MPQRWGAAIGSVRALLVLTTVSRADPAEIVQALEKPGVKVRVDDTQPEKPVVTVILWGPQFKVEMLRDLKEFKSLQNLRIGGPWITDAGVKDLKELTNLKLLEIRSPTVTDAALKELQEALPRLKIPRASPGTGEIK
jgi:hypothetical protein